VRGVPRSDDVAGADPASGPVAEDEAGPGLPGRVEVDVRRAVRRRDLEHHPTVIQLESRRGQDLCR
jgi:hypothetical protein